MTETEGERVRMEKAKEETTFSRKLLLYKTLTPVFGSPALTLVISEFKLALYSLTPSSAVCP